MPPGFPHFEEIRHFSVGQFSYQNFLSSISTPEVRLPTLKFFLHISTYPNLKPYQQKFFAIFIHFRVIFKKREFSSPTKPAIHRKCLNLVSSISTLTIRISTSNFFLHILVGSNLKSYQQKFSSNPTHSRDSPGTCII